MDKTLIILGALYFFIMYVHYTNLVRMRRIEVFAFTQSNLLSDHYCK